MVNDTFSERLVSSMREKGLKQVDFIHSAAEKGIKLGKSHMSQYVSGKTVPRAEILGFLAETLGVAPGWLLGTTEKEAPLHVTGNAVAASISSATDATDAQAKDRITGSQNHKKNNNTKQPVIPAINNGLSGGTIMREFKKSSKLFRFNISYLI